MENKKSKTETGFTLVELLVVIVLIGVIASISMPALKGFGEANTSAAANRQVIDELAFARIRAMNERTTVYIVFIGPSAAHPRVLQNLASRPAEQKLARRLLSGQYTSYALFTERSVGAQPGQIEPRYLTEWRSLPDGYLFDTNKFNLAQAKNKDSYLRSLSFRDFPFPTANSPRVLLPYLSFNANGQLESEYGEESIGIGLGSVMMTPGSLVADVVVTSPSSFTNTPIRINALTGRAQIARLDLP